MGDAARPPQTRRQRVYEALRDTGRRVSGRRSKQQYGWFYVSTRTVLSALERWRRRSPVPTTLESVTVDQLPARVPGASFRELEPATPPVLPPREWVWPASFPRPGRRYAAPGHVQGCGVLEIPGGVVYGFRSYHGPDERSVLAVASSLWWDSDEQMFTEAEEARSWGIEDLDGTTMTVGAGVAGTNYAHCLLQSVPRLDLLRRGFGLDADRFLLDERSPRALFDALDLVGIPRERLLLAPRRSSPAYRCEVLRGATSPPLDAAWPVSFLHELFLPDPPVARSRRIYVRREGVRRVVRNDDDVIALLERSGFEVVTMDGLTVHEQATTFASADAIVAPHGAALANLVFAAPGTPVVELMGRNTASAVYAQVSWRRGLRYEVVMGAEPAPPDRWWTWQEQADTIADVDELRRTLERLGIA